MKLGILKSESTNKAIISSMTLSLIAKMLVFIQSMVVSYAFGTQKSTDILWYVMSLIVLLTTLVSSINQQVLVPAVISIRNNISEEDSKRFITYIYMVYFAIGAIGAFLLFLSPANTLGMLSKFEICDIQANIDIVRFVIPTFFLIILNSFMLDIFTSYRYFTLPMLLEMIKSILTIIFVVFLQDSFAVTSQAIGIFCGNLVQFLILNILLITVVKCRFSFKRYKIEGKVRKNIFYVVLGQVTTFIKGFLIMYLLSGFNAGVYTAMEYGQKINAIVISVIIGQISTVVGINIIEQFTKGKLEELNRTFQKYLKTSLFLIMPFCFMMALNAEPTISILFERGKFDRNAALLTAGFFQYFILILPLKLMDTFIVRLIIAKQIQRISFLWHIGENLIMLPVVWVMINRLGYYGYPFGLLLSTGIYILLLFLFMVRRQFEYIDSISILKFSAVNIILNGVITFLLHSVVKAASLGHNTVNSMIILSVSSLAYTILYIALGYCTRSNREIISRISGFIRLKAKSSVSLTQ